MYSFPKICLDLLYFCTELHCRSYSFDYYLTFLCLLNCSNIYHLLFKNICFMFEIYLFTKYYCILVLCIRRDAKSSKPV